MPRAASDEEAPREKNRRPDEPGDGSLGSVPGGPSAMPGSAQLSSRARWAMRVKGALVSSFITFLPSGSSVNFAQLKAPQ